MESDILLMTAYSGATNLRFMVFIEFIGVIVRVVPDIEGNHENILH